MEFVCFFKQKTAYEMRISDWSSDVCSSDLGNEAVERLFRANCRYLPARVHESLDRRGKAVLRLQARIEHDTARNRPEYEAKLDHYAELFARQRDRQSVV